MKVLEKSLKVIFESILTALNSILIVFPCQFETVQNRLRVTRHLASTDSIVAQPHAIVALTVRFTRPINDFTECPDTKHGPLDFNELFKFIVTFTQQ